MKNHNYFVYIVGSKRGTLYTGVTNNLQKRIHQHKKGIFEGFTKKYKCHILLYAEHFQHIQEAIAREKQIKRWRRDKKDWLIGQMNPLWEDLSEKW